MAMGAKLFIGNGLVCRIVIDGDECQVGIKMATDSCAKLLWAAMGAGGYYG